MELEDYSKYYIQGSDHYLIPKDDFIELFNEMINWKNEAKKLESQFENVKLEQTKKVFNAITNILNNGSCTYRYFIYNLLGFEPNRNAKGEPIGHTEIVQTAYKEILQKYKETIGVYDKLDENSINV